MVERRYYITQTAKYTELNKIIKRKCIDATEKWLSEKCTEIEDLKEKRETFNVHKKVKGNTNKFL